MENADIRWKQRFQNFNRAFILLRSAMEEKDLCNFSDLEREGLIQRFEYTYELAWKTTKDYLEYNGNILSEATARAVIKEAFAVGIIQNGQVFIDMMLSRNLLSHCYDYNKFLEILTKVKSEYLPALDELYMFFLERAT